MLGNSPTTVDGPSQAFDQKSSATWSAGKRSSELAWGCQVNRLVKSSERWQNYFGV